MKKSLFLSMAALLMAGMYSCSSDDDAFDLNKVLDSDQSFYANIQICSTDALTRADGNPNDYDYDNSKDPAFDRGTEDENKINSIFLIFYDADGNRVSTTQVRKDNDAGGAYTNPTPSNGDIIYSGVVQIDVKHGSQMPAYVMCFVNPITSTNFAINPDFETLTSLQAATRPRIIDNNNYFAMSKSVYWGTDRVSNKNNQKIIATPLFSGEPYAANKGTYQLFNTYEEAKKALDEGTESIVNIYVERYAAKVSLEIKSNAAEDDIKLTSNYTLEFVPEFWAVNAYESETYICKSFLSSKKDENGNNVDLTYKELEDALKGSSDVVWKWNNPAGHRCYWAQSPAYYAEAYPRVADDIADNGEDAYALGYYSYDWMSKNASKDLIAKARKIEGNSASTIYARENTISGEALKKAAEDPTASPKAAIASAVIVGHYNLKRAGESVETDMFYVMGNATNGYTIFENTDDMKDFFVRTTIKFASDEDGTEFFDYDNGIFKDDYYGDNKYKEYFTVVHPYASSRKDVVVDSRYVTIQLTKAAYENEDLYVYLEGKYVLVTESNFDEINKQMFYTAGTTQGYKDGKVFYNIPIKHLGFYRDGNVNAGKSGTESTFDWKNCLSGDFGLVRNHSYSIVVDKIKGLGNGIPDPNEPIVPPTDPEEYYIGAKIIVLNWAVVPTQHVTL